MKDFNEKKFPQNRPDGGEISTESFSSLSPEELAAAMEQMLDDMTEEDYDPELLNAYLDALDEKAPMPEVPDAEVSFARFRKKLLSIVPEQQNTAPAHRVRGRSLRRVVVTVAATVALLFALMVGAQAAGLDVFGNLAKWTDDLFWFLPSPGQGETSEYYSLFHEALENQSLPKELAPTWYPEGFTAGEPEVWDDEFGTVVQLDFNNTETDGFLTVSVERYSNPTDIGLSLFEKDSTPVDVYTSNNRSFYILSNLGNTVAVWADENLLMSIRGNLSIEEIKVMINSIGGS